MYPPYRSLGVALKPENSINSLVGSMSRTEWWVLLVFLYFVSLVAVHLLYDPADRKDTRQGSVQPVDYTSY